MKTSITLIALVALVAIVPMGCGPAGQSGGSSTGPKGPVVVLDDSNFAETIKEGVVLVDFWATWCGPCQTQGPIVENVSALVEGKAVVAKAPETASKFGIQSIPTLVVFKDGKPGKKFVGVTQADALVAAITEAVGSE